MRTKTLLVTAALAAAGVATSMAQSNVYSLNVVGYVNVPLVNGFQLIANPLNVSSGNTLTATIGTNVPDGTLVYKYANGHFLSPSTFFGPPDNVWDVEQTINPGEGCFVNCPGTASITFTGEVLQGSLTNPIPAGFSIRSSQVPQAGGLSSVLGYPGKDGDIVYTYNATTHHYDNPSSFFGPPDNVWDTEPVIAPGQAFFLNAAAANSWTRTFTVN